MDGMLTLRILTPEEVVFDGAVRNVSLPGKVCPFEVLPQHAPMISSLVTGELQWVGQDGTPGSLAIKSGIVKIEADTVQACVVPQTSQN